MERRGTLNIRDKVKFLDRDNDPEALDFISLKEFKEAPPPPIKKVKKGINSVLKRKGSDDSLSSVITGMTGITGLTGLTGLMTLHTTNTAKQQDKKPLV